MKTIIRRAPPDASIFEAEACGILAALQLITKYIVPSSTVFIYTDSKSVLLTLDSKKDVSNLILRIQKRISCVSSKYLLKLVWVPSHSNIEGNGYAGRLARQGVDSPT